MDAVPISDFERLVSRELARARSKHPAPIHSWHEGFAVLLEEVDEVKQEVFHGRNPNGLLAELIQVAAMCQRMAEDTNLIERAFVFQREVEASLAVIAEVRSSI